MWFWQIKKNNIPQKLEAELHTHNPEYAELRDIGRQLMQADSRNLAQVQETLGTVESHWESTQTAISDKLHYIASILHLWQQYEDTHTLTCQTLTQVQPVLQESLVLSSQHDVKKMLDKYKVSRDGI